MKQLQQAREVLQAKKAEEAKIEEQRCAREAAAAGEVQTWLDELVKASKVRLVVKAELDHTWWTVYIGATTNVISVRAKSSDDIAYKYQDGHSGDARGTTWGEIQHILCQRVAKAEWDQAQEIASKLTTTPAVT